MLVETIDGDYGVLKEDGNFTGVVGMLQRQVRGFSFEGINLNM